MRNNNAAIIRKIAGRTLSSDKKRNIMAICAITLTAVLFTTLFTLGIGSIDMFQKATMRQSGSSAHAVINYIDDEEFEKISKHPLVKEIAYTRILSDSVDNPELLKRHGELWYMDDNGLKQGFYEPIAGNRPVAENEIMMDTKTMLLLKLPQQIGAKVKLVLTIHGNQIERDFVLSGWWESDPAFNASILITSKAYIDRHIKELVVTYDDDYSLVGLINANIRFSNSFNMQAKLDRVILESGFDGVNKNAPNYVDGNINWAYLSTTTGGDPITTAAMFVALMLVAFTGYLIIYNIFQISVLRNIRYYGLLKTIGATGRQIKNIITLQATVLSLIGIPIGLALGYTVGTKLVPMVLAQTDFTGTTSELSANPIIFIASAVFAWITVCISTRKPGKIAAKVSPMEAIRYTDSDVGNKRTMKRSTNGGKLYKMALFNLGRTKKRTALVFISLSLSLVLLNCVFTLSQGMDMDKFLSKFVDNDFLIAHANYFNSHYFGTESAVEESIITNMEAQPGFEAGGRLYKTNNEYFTVEDSNNQNKYNQGHDSHQIADVYGLDDLPLERLEVIEGELDIEKLKSGGYILVGVNIDDFGKPEAAKFNVGDTVILHNYHMQSSNILDKEYTTQVYEVLAIVKINYFSNSNRTWSSYTFYMPSSIYLPLTYEKTIMSYTFNVADELEEHVESFLKYYTENEEPLMHYESKETHVKEFMGMRNLILSIGSILSGIIGLIGILNLINTVFASVITRRQEFAMLQSIGMTKRQLRNMLCLEGLYYAVGTIIVSFVLGVLSSHFIIRILMSGLWFVTYQFIVLPLIICWPIFFLISLFIPIIIFNGSMKESVVERLREVE